MAIHRWVHRFRWYLIAAIALFALGFTTSQLSAEHVGNCTPGYPTCWADGVCDGCCYSYSCPGGICGFSFVFLTCVKCGACPP